MSNAMDINDENFESEVVNSTKGIRTKRYAK